MKKGMALEEARGLEGRTVRVRWSTTTYRRAVCPDCGSDRRGEPVMERHEHEALGKLHVAEWDMAEPMHFKTLVVGDQQHVDNMEGDDTEFAYVEWEVVE